MRTYQTLAMHHSYFLIGNVKYQGDLSGASDLTVKMTDFLFVRSDVYAL